MRVRAPWRGGSEYLLIPTTSYIASPTGGRVEVPDVKYERVYKGVRDGGFVADLRRVLREAGVAR